MSEDLEQLKLTKKQLVGTIAESKGVEGLQFADSVATEVREKIASILSDYSEDEAELAILGKYMGILDEFIEMMQG
jgi:hypothetical protein